MQTATLLKTVDHTLLHPTATWPEIQALCDEGLFFQTASVCIPPCFVRRASDYLENRLPVCTVVGFPNGYHTTKTKCCETEDALENGALEIDMVISLGLVKSAAYTELVKEIQTIKSLCQERILKVIVETCLLTQPEKIALCKVVSDSGADYIKTSTGFSTGGATREDITLMKAHIAPHVKIKAAGGIRSLRDANDFLALGASRLGTSRVVKFFQQKGGN